MFVMENAGWLKNDDTAMLTSTDGYFDISIPLSFILGFAEDYQRIIVNAKHELILIRSNTDTNAVVQIGDLTQDGSFNISLSKIEWMVPYIKVSDRYKIDLLNCIQKDLPVPIGYRTWEMYENPILPAATKHIWVVKTSTQLEKPRYIVLGFQTAKKNIIGKNASEFDHCNIRDVKLFLNS